MIKPILSLSFLKLVGIHLDAIGIHTLGLKSRLHISHELSGSANIVIGLGIKPILSLSFLKLVGIGLGFRSIYLIS
jgi:hypothetical protein